MLRLFEGVAAEIEEERHPQLGERLPPDAERLATVFQEDDLPVGVADGHDLAIVVDVEKLGARRRVGLSRQVVHLVVTVDGVAVLPPVERNALGQLLLDVGAAGGRCEGRQPVFV